MSIYLLDELFKWASEQPVQNSITVDIAIATNSKVKNNLVTYAEGKLSYDGGGSNRFREYTPRFVAALDRSGNGGIKQYFSDRKFTTNQNHDCPFNCAKTDLLGISITNFTDNYTVYVESSNPDFQFSFEPGYDMYSGIMYYSIKSTFITISLCNRQSIPPGPR